MPDKRIGLYLGTVTSIEEQGGLATAHRLLLKEPDYAPLLDDTFEVSFDLHDAKRFGIGVWVPEWLNCKTSSQVIPPSVGVTLILDVYQILTETCLGYKARRWGEATHFFEVVNQMGNQPLYRLWVKYPEAWINYWTGRILENLRGIIHSQLDDFPTLVLPPMALQVHYFGEKRWHDLPEEKLIELLAR